MDRLTLDQTPSESVLLRVLYVLKFLRAMLLHVTLAAIAATVFAVTGVIGFYPVADSFTHSLRPGAIQTRQQFGVAGEWGYWIAALLVFAVFVAFLLWVYRSITEVRTRALRVQAVVFVLLSVISLVQAAPTLSFAFAKLNPLFATLATVSVVLTMLVVPLNVAASLWQVSLVPERSSFVATLDPRLVHDRRAYLNKLLDLPRTPLRSGKTFAAYVVAVTGAVLLIASLMYLLTMGGASNRLSTLAQICKDDLVSRCLALSTEWAWRIPLALVLATVGIKAAGWLQSMAKRLSGLSVSDVLRHPNDAFVLYLRPFDTDDVVLPTPKLPPWSRLFSYRPLAVRVEEELFDVADGHLPLIAVGKPGTQDATEGGVAYRAFLADSEWQGYVADKIRRAERIVLVMKASAGVRWEIERVVAEGAAPKTLFLFDPALADAERAELEHALAPVLQGSEASDAAVDARAIGFWFRGATRVEVVNANRSATSYRTAFSTFLADPAVAASTTTVAA
jgi:hypothetical protein